MGVAKVGSEIPVNTTETSDQYESSIATLTNGDFVVVWTDYSGNFGEEDSGVVGKIFDADGNVLVDEFTSTRRRTSNNSSRASPR